PSAERPTKGAAVQRSLLAHFGVFGERAVSSAPPGDAFAAGGTHGVRSVATLRRARPAGTDPSGASFIGAGAHELGLAVGPIEALGRAIAGLSERGGGGAGAAGAKEAVGAVASGEVTAAAAAGLSEGWLQTTD